MLELKEQAKYNRPAETHNEYIFSKPLFESTRLPGKGEQSPSGYSPQLSVSENKHLQQKAKLYDALMRGDVVDDQQRFSVEFPSHSSKNKHPLSLDEALDKFDISSSDSGRRRKMRRKRKENHSSHRSKSGSPSTDSTENYNFVPPPSYNMYRSFALFLFHILLYKPLSLL